jgi:hypothetical protein
MKTGKTFNDGDFRLAAAFFDWNQIAREAVVWIKHHNRHGFMLGAERVLIRALWALQSVLRFETLF